jgi:hypothetical protein
MFELPKYKPSSKGCAIYKLKRINHMVLFTIGSTGAQLLVILISFRRSDLRDYDLKVDSSLGLSWMWAREAASGNESGLQEGGRSALAAKQRRPRAAIRRGDSA